MLVAALALSFASALYTGTFSHEDFLAADARHAKWSQAWNNIPETSAEYPSFDILSLRFVSQGMWCMALLVCSLCVGLLAYVSLSYSDAREDEAEFAAWFKYFKYFIFCGYLLVFAGLYVFFNLNHTAIDIAYPRYPSDDSKDCYNPATGQMKETYYSEDIIHQRTAGIIATAMRIVLPILVVGVVGGHMCIITRKHALQADSSASYGCKDLAEAIKWREAGHIDESEFNVIKKALFSG
jgi:hypothetical protein